MEANAKTSNDPLFKVIPSLIKSTDLEALSKYSNAELGEDPSSQYFIPRQKSIAFVAYIDGEFFTLQQNFFIQNAKYNDFSGGYKRFYKTLPDWLVQGHMKDALKSFADTYQFPNYACILVQLQKSTIPAFAGMDNGQQSSGAVYQRQTTVTGQGIHTDGHDRAMLVCIDRQNVSGGSNYLYEDINGDQNVMPGTVLEKGDSLFFKDNQIYHYVSKAEPKDCSRDMTRTMLIAHYPANYFLFGKENPRNQLLRGEAIHKLRSQSEEDAVPSKRKVSCIYDMMDDELEVLQRKLSEKAI